MHPNIRILFLASICLIACQNKPAAPDPKTIKPPSPVVDVLIAQAEEADDKIEVNGSVIPYENVEIHPEIGGRVVFLNINEGAKVEKGAILAKVNAADLEAQLEKTKTLLKQAQITEKRLHSLLEVNGINQADYDNALNQVNSLTADEEITKAQIEKTVIKAPFSGVLGLRLISLGAYVSPTTPLTTLQQLDKLKIDFAVPDINANLVEKGRTITAQTTEGTFIKAAVVATEGTIDPTTRTLKARAIYTGGQIKAGAYVRVFLDVPQKKADIIVPTSCIIPNASSKQVIVVKEGKGKFVNVETGKRNAGTIEITKGLQKGDSVVVTGVLFVRPNQQVAVRKIKKIGDF